jgi:hypothetical protein
MRLADVIVMIGSSIDDDIIGKDDGIELLTGYGGFTPLGAADVLSTWRTIHDRYEWSP